MSRTLLPASALAALAVVTVGAGCGFGPGDSTDGEVKLTVTRDYGAEELVEATSSDPTESETVMRLLDREADIDTRYGGGFVHSIEGIAGSAQDGRTSDWFFYVNGIESAVGAAEAAVRGGDRIWWDHHDWTEVMRAPAVVGSWPEPFLQASAGPDRLPVRVVCAGSEDPCAAAEDALADAGVTAVITEFGEEDPGRSLRIVVGRWSEIRSDGAARLIRRGPGASGVFARHDNGHFQLLDSQAEVAGEADGLVAATRNGESPPAWVVTGVDEEGVVGAVSLLDADVLENRYALGLSGDAAIPIPAAGKAP